MQRKSLGGVSLFFLALLGFAGCVGTSEPTIRPQPKFGHLRVACPEPLGTALVKTYGHKWERDTEAEIELLSYDPQRAEPPEADVWIIPTATLPHYAAAGKLHTLPIAIPTDTDYAWDGLLPLYREKLLIWDRQRYALPLLGESLLCCYRSDWFAQPEHQKAFEEKYKRKLEPPATWEQFADIAEYFSQSAHPTKGPSLPPLPADDDTLEREFYTIAANYATLSLSAENKANNDEDTLFSFQYEVVTGRPRIGGGGFVHALQLLKRLQPLRAPADHFDEERTVFRLVETAKLGELQKNPKLKGHYSVCRMPGANGYYDSASPQKWVAHENNRIPYLGAGDWLGVVPKSATAEEAAFSLLTYLSNPAVSKQVLIDPRIGGGPTRHDHLDAKIRWESFGLDDQRNAKVKEVLVDMLEHPGLRNPAFRLRTPDEASHRQALDEELRAALQGVKTPADALRDAAARWLKLDEQKGMNAHRAEYRISLGLLGKI